MRLRYLVPALPIALLGASPALAAPGLGEEVYGATVEKGETEAEVQYDRLSGGPDSGEDVIKLELSHGLTDNLRVGMIGELEKEAGASRKVDAIGFEAIYHLGRIGPVDFAVYGEYEVGVSGDDKVETKLLFQHRSKSTDLRFNLIARKPLVGGTKVNLGYAASADFELREGFELGVEAFGDLGDFDQLAPRAEHFAGPVARFEIEGLGRETELSLGYLFALGAAREDTDGQLRLKLEFGF